LINVTQTAKTRYDLSISGKMELFHTPDATIPANHPIVE